jgi:hypothetical protein
LEFDDFEELQNHRDEMVQQTKNLIQQVDETTFHCSLKNDSSNYNEEEEAIDELKIFDTNISQKVLIAAYSCNSNLLYNVINFAEFYHKSGP